MMKVKKNVHKIPFIKLCQAAKLFHYGPGKGIIFFLPNSYQIWEKMQRYLDGKFSNLGVQNVYFPSLIPLSLFEKEKQHIKGFSSEFFTVARAKKQQAFKDKFVLRPTSEVIFSSYFHHFVHSYRDLPLLLNQWVSVWRWEENPNPFLRNMEFLWQEGHTIHANKNEALSFCQKIRDEYQKFFTDYLAIPVFIGQKSQLEKFAGAQITWTLETILPDGQFLQLATVHYLGQTFTKEFKVQFLNQNNQLNLPFQTSWGVSTRAIAALVQTHSDGLGLVLPFDIAKHQIFVLPIYGKTTVWERKKIDLYCQKIKSKLSTFGLNFWEFTNDQNFSIQCQKAELMGVPIRIEVGMKELNEQKITYILRHDLKKVTVHQEFFYQNFYQIVAKLKKDIFETAQKKINEKIVKIVSFDTYTKAVKDKAFQVYFCNQIDCEKEIKNLTKTVSRFLWPKLVSKGETSSLFKCFKCQKETNLLAIFGRSY